jgi:hypothetical protein
MKKRINAKGFIPTDKQMNAIRKDIDNKLFDKCIGKSYNAKIDINP